ncbi:extracellular solute-binding protein [Synechocystis sp. FACHB-383]|uniref:extracellular solute-binding protein n=1 Tax=Synechocystis sp. FACHB-383 TaxID=2692864 RepID=UPI001681E80B|nr:extracellular solute-binding protein [Synechocystis sp. FACHB-383]MBD2652349.1 extracellular solute-binding protein [Synechocystis sp. FACHB-383]
MNRKTTSLGLLLFFACMLRGATFANPIADSDYQPKDGVVRLYGAGGPHTAIIRAGKLFTAKTGIPVDVQFGPESQWSQNAQRDADIIWGTSEQSMTAFLETYKEFNSNDVEPIYLATSVIAVRKGNPKNIRGFDDLLRPGMKIVVTEGAGVYNTSGTGVWEDIAGRTGSLDDIKAFRRNIIAFAKGSGASFQAFKEMNADAWITWKDWPINHPEEAEWVELSPDRVIYRDLNVVTNAKADPGAELFIDFLQTEEAEAIFHSEGWSK